jgi:hypothetical protein
MRGSAIVGVPGINLLGDGLRQALDPRLRARPPALFRPPTTWARSSPGRRRSAIRDGPLPVNLLFGFDHGGDLRVDLEASLEAA